MGQEAPLPQSPRQEERKGEVIKGAIRKGFGPYSSGTRVEILVPAENVKPPHGYSTVRVVCDKKVIDVEDDNLVRFLRR